VTSRFRALQSRNFRLWASGSLVSNTGTWMQRTAQDWLVLTQLTHHSGTATGVTVGLQFVPLLLFSPHSGVLADRFSKRRLLLLSQSAMGLGALTLSLLVITHTAQLWQVFCCAFGVGLASALDNPARQALIPEIVLPDDVPSAVGILSGAQNIARMVGPAAAGLLIGLWGTGPVFAINAGGCLAVLATLVAMRPAEMHRQQRSGKGGSVREGLRYVRSRPDLVRILVCTSLVSTFTMNNAINMAMMSTTVFHRGAGEFGMLSTILALGGLGGAMVSVRQGRPRLGLIGCSALVLGLTMIANGLMPNFASYAITLVPDGFLMAVFMNACIMAVQLGTRPDMRGRVLALYVAIQLGTTPIGSPLIGWIGETFGARSAVLVGGFGALVAAACSGVAIPNRRGNLSGIRRLSNRPRAGARSAGESH
jgi:MFS family permease